MPIRKRSVSTSGAPAEPEPELVERAIVELLTVAQRQGITADDLIQLLESGMQMSDFLAAFQPQNVSDAPRLKSSGD